jgi:hypothetical protein
MTLLGRFAPRCAPLLALLLGGLSACSTSGSGGFKNNGGSGSQSDTSTSTSTGTNTNTNSDTSATSSTGTQTGTSSIVTNSDAGVSAPPSNVEDPDTYTTSCEQEDCTGDEGCFDTCPNGSCCVHSCPGQTGTVGSATACCDRQGGVVPGASCGS